MTFSAKDMIRKRKSVRTFTGEPLKYEDRAAIDQFIQSPTNPFDVPVDFRLLDVKEYGLSSPVIVGADLYLAAKVKRCKHYEIGFGYSFEHVCLYAESLGLGTVMLAASLSRAAFEKAMDVQNDEVLPVASPIGYPAQKKSIRESLMRKGLKADVGIALAHFDLTMQENGHNGQFVEANPGIALPENVQYIISYKREK